MSQLRDCATKDFLSSVLCFALTVGIFNIHYSVCMHEFLRASATELVSRANCPQHCTCALSCSYSIWFMSCWLANSSPSQLHAFYHAAPAAPLLGATYIGNHYSSLILHQSFCTIMLHFVSCTHIF